MKRLRDFDLLADDEREAIWASLHESHARVGADGNDFLALRRIIEPVVSVEHAGDGLLSLRFEDGTRLAFLCGPTGRLNGVTVQHGPGTPELRLPPESADDLHGDPEYAAWLAKCAEACSCCPHCAPESPCGGIMAGGMCDLFECTCHQQDDDLDIEQPEVDA